MRCGGLPFHVVLVVRNFRYAADALFYDGGSGVNILKKFTHRISIDLPLDDVQTLFPTYLRRDVAGKTLYGSTQSDAFDAEVSYGIFVEGKGDFASDWGIGELRMLFAHERPKLADWEENDERYKTISSRSPPTPSSSATR